MILRNSKNQERNFKVLYKIEYDDKTYLIYEDYITNKFYVGRKDKDQLKKVGKEEMLVINKILEGVNKE